METKGMRLARLKDNGSLSIKAERVIEREAHRRSIKQALSPGAKRQLFDEPDVVALENTKSLGLVLQSIDNNAADRERVGQADVEELIKMKFQLNEHAEEFENLNNQ